MQYKGYVGATTIDEEAGVIRGRVVNTRDTITFQGATVGEVRRAFEESIDDYLEFCASRGEAPEKPFSGKLLIRTTPTVHAALSVAAQSRGESINRVASRILARGVRANDTALINEPPRNEPGDRSKGRAGKSKEPKSGKAKSKGPM